MEQKTKTNEFHKTLRSLMNQGPELTEISFAPRGTSRFQTSMYLENIDEKLWSEILGEKKNIAFAMDISPGRLKEATKKLNGEFRVGKKLTRMTTDSMFIQKKLLAFDLDIKEFIPGFTEWEGIARCKKARQIGRKFRKKFEMKFGEGILSYAHFTGNGFHVYFKAEEKPVSCDDTDSYKRLYEKTASILDTCLPSGAHFDRACKNPGRLFRLPGSRNYKSKVSVPTKEIFSNLKADASNFFDEIQKITEVEDDAISEFDGNVDGSIPKGQRNTRLVSLAGTLRTKGVTEETILAALQAENRLRCKPPLKKE